MKILRSFLLIAAVCGLTFCAAAEKVYFKSFREKAEHVVPNSPEDFALGRALMKEVRKLAAKKKLADGKQHFYTEPVMYRSGKLYYSHKKWFDHNLFVSRDLWDGSPQEFQDASILKSIELIRLAGFDGFSPIIGKREGPAVFSKVAAKDNREPEKSKVVPVFWFSLNGLSLKHMAQIKTCAEGPTWKFNGKPVAFSYNSDNYSPEMVAAALKNIKKHTGLDVAYVHGVGSMWGTGGDPYHNFIEHGEVSAVMILKYFDKLTQYLEVGEGIQFRNRLPDRNSRLFVKFYDQLILPLYAAACAQEKFNNQKILGLSVQAAYGYYWGSQPLDRRGTKTLRSYLELCRKHKVDFVHGIEWDETNEDTYLDPSVCKPMACARITRYYSNRMKGLKPVAFPGDDLSLPNLIISMPRQYILGAPFEVELLQVPDTDENIPYSVQMELFDHRNKKIYSSGKYTFNASSLQDHTIVLPAEKVASARAVYPRLAIEYRGKHIVIDSGLPASVIRATVSRDYSWYSTPLRNLMIPAKEKVIFKNNGFYSKPGVRKVHVETDLHFPGKQLNMVEVLQNSMEIFAFDPQNEFLQNDPDRQLFRLSGLFMNSRSSVFSTLDISIINAPGACYFEPVKHKRNSYLPVASQKYKVIPWKNTISRKRVQHNRHQIVTLFSVPVKEVANAVVTISGVRLDGLDKGKAFSWSLPLRELGKYGIKMKNFEDGIHFGLETFFKPELLPLPLNREGAVFSVDIAHDLPEGILMLRAVSKDGKVWWSKPFAPVPESGTKSPISVYDPERQAFELEVDSVRVPRIVYKFDPQAGGDALTTDAGREFYGGLGTLATIPSGFEGAAHSQDAVCFSAQLAQNLQKKQPNRPKPEWEKQSDGRWALRFAPGKGQFIVFPPTTVPQKTGFTVKARIKFDSTADQLVFGQCGPRYLTGFQLRVEKGRFVIDYKHRMPHASRGKSALFKTHKSSLVPVSGKWNTVWLSYNGRGFRLSVNGKQEFFSQSGHAQWLSIFAFGGTNPNNKKTLECFSGLLSSLEIIHRPLL